MAPAKAKKGVKKKGVKKAKKAAVEDEVGPLAGKIKDLLPPALDLSKLAAPVASAAAANDSDSEDDAPPEEVTSLLPQVEKKEEVAAVQPAKKKTRRGGKQKQKGVKSAAGEDDAADDDDPEDEAVGEDDEAAWEDDKEAGGGYFWEDPENRQLLGQIREQDAKRRERNLKTVRIEKDGFILTHVDAAGTALGGANTSTSAQDFLNQELFANRKRKRTMKDRIDRNVLGGTRMGSHRRF